MQVENDYDKEVYNGDLGIVSRIDVETSELRGLVGASSDRKSGDDGSQRAELVANSLLEEDGFELSVPLASIRLIFAEEKGLQVDQSGQNKSSVFTVDQRFESPLLHW